MRDFSEFEKDVLRKLQRYKSNGVNLNFLSILDPYFKNRAIEIDRVNRTANILFNTKSFAEYDSSTNAWMPKNDLVKEVAPTVDIIISLIFLLSYLENQGLIFMYDLAKDSNKISSFPELDKKPTPIPLEISDKNVVELLIKFFNKEIHISQSVVELVNNNFKLKSDIQHEQTITIANRSIKITWIAIVISTLIGLLSLGIAVTFNKKSIELSNQPTKIESSELIELLDSNQDILNELRQYRGNQNLHDSLKLQIDSMNIQKLDEVKQRIDAIRKIIKDANKR